MIEFPGGGQFAFVWPDDGVGEAIRITLRRYDVRADEHEEKAGQETRKGAGLLIMFLWVKLLALANLKADRVCQD